ncbi:MAG: nucleoside 2-deoxyribosyltransferase [Caulobacteraceae bacterium]
MDTAKTDFTLAENVSTLVGELNAATGRAAKPMQRDLFQEEDSVDGEQLTFDLLKVLKPLGSAPTLRFPVLPRRPLVYLAAPFTDRARRDLAQGENSGGLLPDNPLELITDSYRRDLSKIARSIERHGYRILLPHRDINGWGARSLPAGEIASRCLAAVKEADYFVGLISESLGSHVELGFALGLGKPSLLLVRQNRPISFFGHGIGRSGLVKTLYAPSLRAIIARLAAEDALRSLGEEGGLQ